MDPLGGVRSSLAQGKAMQKGLKNKVNMAKAMEAKVARFDKAVIIHLLIGLLIGILMGATVFLPFYPFEEYSFVLGLFVGLSLLCWALGAWAMKRMWKKVDWSDEESLTPELYLHTGFVALLAVGIALAYRFLPEFLSAMSALAGKSHYQFMMPGVAILALLPFLGHHLFQAVEGIEAKKYQMWYYPKTYVEKEPTWSMTKKVMAHMVFRLSTQHPDAEEVLVKLPMEANLGEVVYLFINDYNSNKHPDKPIRDLRKDDGSVGWLFYTEKSMGSKGFRYGRKYLDVEKSVEENGIEDQSYIYFERFIS